jgi:hypothetical protein
MSDGKAFVRCMTDNEEDTTKLYDLLNGFKNSGANLAFDMINGGTGDAVKFDGIISFIAKEGDAINFTVMPKGSISIK